MFTKRTSYDLDEAVVKMLGVSIPWIQPIGENGIVCANEHKMKQCSGVGQARSSTMSAMLFATIRSIIVANASSASRFSFR